MVTNNKASCHKLLLIHNTNTHSEYSHQLLSRVAAILTSMDHIRSLEGNLDIPPQSSHEALILEQTQFRWSEYIVLVPESLPSQH